MKYLLDSNTIIYYMDGTLTPHGFAFVLAAFQSQECAVSIISKIEVLGFPFPSETQMEKAEKLLASLPIHAITDEVVEKTIEIRRSRKPKVADAIIAATAILQGLQLISRNEKDFKNLPGLDLINPFDL
ncbi:MAG: type II toxin-antitoxin system VapC family toxin [Saprospiraceae bacterium]|nr:type II toxin-antitoxin system VapC family toxin [Saprospiraceae bacterium]